MSEARPSAVGLLVFGLGPTLYAVGSAGCAVVPHTSYMAACRGVAAALPTLPPRVTLPYTAVYYIAYVTVLIWFFWLVLVLPPHTPYRAVLG